MGRQMLTYAIASMIINIIHNIIVIVIMMMIIVVVVVYRHRFGRLASQMAMLSNALDISISRTAMRTKTKQVSEFVLSTHE